MYIHITVVIIQWRALHNIPKFPELFQEDRVINIWLHPAVVCSSYMLFYSIVQFQFVTVLRQSMTLFWHTIPSRDETMLFRLIIPSRYSVTLIHHVSQSRYSTVLILSRYSFIHFIYVIILRSGLWISYWSESTAEWPNPCDASPALWVCYYPPHTHTFHITYMCD